MVTIRINEEAKTLDDADAQWVNQAINRRREAGLLVCVEVHIEERGVNMPLRTKTCGGAGGGGGRGRAPNPQETEVFALWEKHHLKELDFSSGNVWSFLVQLRKLLG